MKFHSPLSLLATVSLLAGVPSFAGESPYNPGGAANKPTGQPQSARPVEQEYSYYCYARSLDGQTEYRTDIMSEPMPHSQAFIGSAHQAWDRHLEETLGKYKAVGDCYEGPTSSAKPAWEQGWKQQQKSRKVPVHVDWHYQ